jgi:hypothetical protein
MEDDDEERRLWKTFHGEVVERADVDEGTYN